MDRLIYVAMTGAKQATFQQATVANNLANASTPGFRAELAAFRAIPVQGGTGLPTRTFAVEQTTGSDFTPGPLMTTGRNLDIAVQTEGFLAVQTPGGEAYTRNGSLQIDPTGLLRDAKGFPVLGDAGPITLPPQSIITIAKDGTISAAPDANPAQINEVGRLKLVRPPENQLERGNDGQFRLRDGGVAQADATVQVLSGALESSNVNPVSQLVQMIDTQRLYDMQVRFLQTADQNARSAAQIMTIT